MIAPAIQEDKFYLTESFKKDEQKETFKSKLPSKSEKIDLQMTVIHVDTSSKGKE